MLSVLITLLLSTYLIYEWYKLWSVIGYKKHNSLSIKHKNLGNRKYTLIIILVLISSYLALIILLSFTKIFIINKFSIDESLPSLFFSTCKLYFSYLIIPFLSLAIYSIKRHSARLMFNISCTTFFLLSSFSIIEVNNIYLAIQKAEGISLFFLYNCFILDFIFMCFLCAILDYLISRNCVSELNALYLNSIEINHLLLLIYIYVCYMLFLVAFLGENKFI